LPNRVYLLAAKSIHFLKSRLNNLKLGRLGSVCFLIFIGFFLASNLPFVPLPHPVEGDTVSSVYVTPVQTCCIFPTNSSPVFTVNVKMDLSGAEPINGFDVRLNYTNFYSPVPPAHGVVKAISLDYSNNVFVNAGYTVTTLASCIDDVTYGPNGFCAIDDVSAGQVHVAQAITSTTSATISGPLNNALLFSVTFTVNATGTSLFYFDRANLSNPGGLPANPHFIPVTTRAGVFGDTQLVAFFDYSSTFSPSVLSGVNARFDASASFRSGPSGQTTLNMPRFAWDFGDGNKTTTNNPISQHAFQKAGNYTVGLVVNDTNPGGGAFQRIVQVSPFLGTLHVSVKNQRGGPIQTIVTVKLYNSTTPVPPLCRACTQMINAGGTVDFRGLTPGLYTLNATGPGVDPGGRQTQVQVGWPTMETVYLTEIQPPGPSIIPIVIFGVVIGGGLGLVGLGLVVRWRRTKRLMKTGGLLRKTRNHGRV
jgi:hypothetical protein